MRVLVKALRGLAIGGLAFVGLWGTTAESGQTVDAIARALTGIPGADAGALIPLSDAAVGGAFPQHQFYVLRFLQYPVARPVPKSLGANNLFVRKPGGALEHVRDADGLEAFFRAALGPLTNKAEARVAVEAWLRLAQEFYQDGFFLFSIPADSTDVTSAADGGLRATGKAVVVPRGGNEGEIEASLTFDRQGALMQVSRSGSVRQGMRPICQATKLLDPDPVVRSTAERELLVMGRAAKPYLDAQRATASPILRRAIDKAWQRILAEGP